MKLQLPYSHPLSEANYDYYSYYSSKLGEANEMGRND